MCNDDAGISSPHISMHLWLHSISTPTSPEQSTMSIAPSSLQQAAVSQREQLKIVQRGMRHTAAYFLQPFVNSSLSIASTIIGLAASCIWAVLLAQPSCSLFLSLTVPLLIGRVLLRGGPQAVSSCEPGCHCLRLAASLSVLVRAPLPTP